MKTELLTSSRYALLGKITKALFGEEGGYWEVILAKALNKETIFEKSDFLNKKLELTVKFPTADLRKFRKMISEKGVGISSIAGALIKKITLSKKIEAATLVFLTPEELGLNNRTMINVIYERAYDYGLTTCPYEVLPYLCEEYKEDKILYIAVEPITIDKSVTNDQIDRQFIFRIVDGTVLDCGYANRDQSEYGSKVQFVFCLKK
jgi:hypothetical protein